MFFGVVFRLTRNLLIMWPLTWTVSSTLGTVSGGFTFGWNSVWIYTAVIIIQGAGIWWIARTRQNNKDSGQKDTGMSKVEAPKRGFTWKDCISSCPLFTQIFLTFLRYNHLGHDNIVNAGWMVMTLSAIFGWVPIFTLRRKGKVPQGKSYTQTTALVDSGIYSIVRHPQYFAGVLMSIALALLSQYWVAAILFFPSSAAIYLDSLREDKRLINKFGEKYVEYMERVPGMNPFRVILRKVVGR